MAWAEGQPRQLPDRPGTIRLRILHRGWTVGTLYRSRTLWGVWMYIAGRGCWNSKNWQKAAGRRWIERADQPATARRRSWAGRPEGRRNVERTLAGRARRTLGLPGRFGKK